MKMCRQVLLWNSNYNSSVCLFSFDSWTECNNNLAVSALNASSFADKNSQDQTKSRIARNNDFSHNFLLWTADSSDQSPWVEMELSDRSTITGKDNNNKYLCTKYAWFKQFIVISWIRDGLFLLFKIHEAFYHFLNIDLKQNQTSVVLSFVRNSNSGIKWVLHGILRPFI